MGMRIFWTLILLVLIVGGFFVAQHYREEKQMADGAVTCVGCMTPDEKTRFDKENSGDTIDGQSERKTRTARQEDAAGNPEGAVAAGQVATTPTTAPSVATTAPAPAQMTSTPLSAPATGSYSLTNGAAPSALPTSDTVAPNPGNGIHFAGSGAYQWYRQGNLTWRVDTVSGGSCIAFATLEEWRKQIVSSHGCGRGV